MFFNIYFEYRILGYYLGNLIEAPKEGIFADNLAKWHNKYGSTFKIQFLGDIYIFTSNQHAIKEILITKSARLTPVKYRIVRVYYFVFFY